MSKEVIARYLRLKHIREMQQHSAEQALASSEREAASASEAVVTARRMVDAASELTVVSGEVEIDAWMAMRERVDYLARRADLAAVAAQRAATARDGKRQELRLAVVRTDQMQALAQQAERTLVEEEGRRERVHFDELAARRTREAAR